MHVGLSRGGAGTATTSTAAATHLRRSEELGERPSWHRTRTGGGSRLAGCARAAGDLDGARSLLDEAERVYVGDYSPDVRPVRAQLARVLAALGDLAAARDWARSRGVSATDELTYLREYEHVTLARLLLAEHAGRVGADVARGDGSPRPAGRGRGGGRPDGPLIEVLVLQRPGPAGGR